MFLLLMGLMMVEKVIGGKEYRGLLSQSQGVHNHIITTQAYLLILFLPYTDVVTLRPPLGRLLFEAMHLTTASLRVWYHL